MHKRAGLRERGQSASDDHLLRKKACSFVAIQLGSVSPATAVPCVGGGMKREEGVEKRNRQRRRRYGWEIMVNPAIPKNTVLKVNALINVH